MACPGREGGWMGRSLSIYIDAHAAQATWEWAGVAGERWDPGKPLYRGTESGGRSWGEMAVHHFLHSSSSSRVLRRRSATNTKSTQACQRCLVIHGTSNLHVSAGGFPNPSEENPILARDW